VPADGTHRRGDGLRELTAVAPGEAGSLDGRILRVDDGPVTRPVTGAGAAAPPARLLERDSYLESLEGWWVDVASGRGRLVLVAGEAGVGKTALVREFCDRRPPRTRVLWGGCDGLRTPRPLAPFADIAAATGGAFAESVARGERPAGSFAALTEELAAVKPTVVALEDLHWADEATLDVVTMLGRRAESVPALVVATYRDDELAADHPLRSVLGELRAGAGVRRLALAPLSLGGVEALTAEAGVDVAHLHRVTAGNPFFVTEVLAAGGAEIPATVRDAVLARARRLTGPARRLLEAVAVVPGRVELPMLEALASDVIDRLEECVASGVLTTGPTDVAFRHELARVAIEESIPPNRRVTLHRAALAMLEARGGESPDSARLAAHAEAAGDREGVLRWAPEAAERAARGGSHREAAAQFARALRFGAGLPVKRRADLLQRRVDECWLTD
jgi:predicted ATPase